MLELHPEIDIVLAYRVGTLAHIYDEIRRQLPNARVIFHDVDLHHLRKEREAELLKTTMRASARETRKELVMIATVDCTIVPTPAEKTLIEEQMPDEPILEFPYIVEVRRSEVPFESGET